MAYASLNSSLVARKGEARPSATRLQVAGQEKRPEASFQPYMTEGQFDSVDFMGPVTRRSEQAKPTWILIF